MFSWKGYLESELKRWNFARNTTTVTSNKWCRDIDGMLFPWIDIENSWTLWITRCKNKSIFRIFSSIFRLVWDRFCLINSKLLILYALKRCHRLANLREENESATLAYCKLLKLLITLLNKEFWIFPHFHGKQNFLE